MKPLPIVVFIVAAAIGWLVAENSARPVKPSASESSASARDERPEQRSRKTRGPDGIAGQRLAAIRASRDPATRMRGTVDLASTLSPSEFADWLEGGWFAVNGVELTLFTKIIEERWINEDPEGFLVWAQKNRSNRAHEILASWAKTNPHRLLGFYKNHPSDTAELQNLGAVARTDPALALQRFQEIAASAGDLNFNYYAHDLLAVLVEKSPAALEAVLDSLPAKLRLQVETTLIGQRMKNSFSEEYQALQHRPDGFILMTKILNGDLDAEDRDIYRNAIFADLANLPASWISAIANNSYGIVTRDNAEQWINANLENYGFTTEQAKRIRYSALSNLYRQPEIALKLLADVEMENSQRTNLLGNIFRNLGNNPDQTEKLIALLGSEDDRETARGFITPKDKNGEPKINNPTDWLTGLATLDPKSGSGSYRFISATADWDIAKISELSRQFATLPDDSKRSVAKNLVGQGNSNNPPLEAEAIRYLIENPDPAPEVIDPNNPNDTPERKNIQFASRYVGKLARTEPTAASEWIATLPAGQPKLWAQKNLHSLWSQYDPAAANEWFGTLPAATRESVGELGKNVR